MTGNFIKDWRRYRGLTQSEFAELMGMTKVSISRMETGTTRYDRHHLERAAFVLKCSPADLISRSPEDGPHIMDIWPTLSPEAKEQLLSLAKMLGGKP